MFWQTVLSRTQQSVHSFMEQFTEEEQGWWAEIVLNTQLTTSRIQKHLKEYQQCQTGQGRKVRRIETQTTQKLQAFIQTQMTLTFYQRGTKPTLLFTEQLYFYYLLYFKGNCSSWPGRQQKTPSIPGKDWFCSWVQSKQTAGSVNGFPAHISQTSINY